MVDLAKRLRELRLVRGWMQGQEGGRLGVTGAVVSADEVGPGAW